jgi:hypothetical protein
MSGLCSTREGLPLEIILGDKIEKNEDIHPENKQAIKQVIYLLGQLVYDKIHEDDKLQKEYSKLIISEIKTEKGAIIKDIKNKENQKIYFDDNEKNNDKQQDFW